MIVVLVVEAILTAVSKYGSVDLGYVLVVVLPSIVQVKDNALSAILTLVPVGNV